MSEATYGTLKGVAIALHKRSWINWAGGYHHASLSGGAGFWVYPDISLAWKFALENFYVSKIWIIDLDAHQGNGY